MRFVECDIREAKKFYKRTKIFALLDDFVKSGLSCARVEDWEHCRASSAANAINQSIKRFKFANIRAFSVRGEVYIVRERVDDECGSDK